MTRTEEIRALDRENSDLMTELTNLYEEATRYVETIDLARRLLAADREREKALRDEVERLKGAMDVMRKDRSETRELVWRLLSHIDELAVERDAASHEATKAALSPSPAQQEEK